MLRVFTIIAMILIFSLALHIPTIQGQQAQTYESTMQSGIERYAAGDFISAKTYFEMALRIKENDPAAQAKLSETIARINEQMEKQELFYGHLDRGDRLNKEGNLNEAVVSYQKALDIFPDDKYTRTQVEEITKILTEKEKKQSDYNMAMQNGEQLIENEKFEEAIIQFQIASNLYPELEIPKTKAAEAQKLLAEQVLKEEQFHQLKQDANQLMLRKNYTEAIAKIEAALVLFPNDAPTLSLLSETKELQAKSEQYEKLLAKADEAYENKQLSEAKKLYADALSFWPQQTYPADMINRIEAYFQSDEYLNKIALAEFLETAEAFYLAEDWINARDNYNKVLDIDPEHLLASERLTEITFKLKQGEELAKKEARFNQLVEQGDQLFDQQSYAEAIAAYNEALAIQQTNELSAKLDLANNQLAAVQAQTEKESQYQNLLSQADNKTELGDLAAAIALLNQAIAIFPENAEGKEKLAAVQLKIDELKLQQEEEDAYQQQLQQAQIAFDAEDWTKARQEYTKALELRPNDEVPQNQINAIDAILLNEANAAANEAAYLQQMETGMLALEDEKLDLAQEAFEKASELKPTERIPKEKILEINQLRLEIVAANEKETSYNLFVEQGDQAYVNQNLAEALEAYRKASRLFPERTYTQNQISLIETSIKQAETDRINQENYTQLIREADQALQSENFQLAKTKYVQALEIFENETYPQNQIKQIDENLALQEALALTEAAYKEKITEADAFKETQKWEEALAAYQQALEIKANETYPVVKINEIRQIQEELAAEKARAAKIEQLTIKLEGEFVSKEFDQALQTAEEIMRLDPENITAKSRIAEIELAKEAIIRENEQRYQQAMQEGDSFLQEKAYQDAIVSFKIALGIKQNDARAQQRIKQVETILEERLLALKTAYNKYIAEADRNYNAGSYDLAIEAYLKAEGTKPDETYPREMIRKIAELMEANKMRELITSATTLASNISRQFSFEPIDVVDRRSNYILIKARNLSENAFPLLVNFGSPTGRNGGFVLPIPENQETNDFIVRIGSQYKWFSEDNTWIELLPENGDIEVSVIQISKGN